MTTLHTHTCPQCGHLTDEPTELCLVCEMTAQRIAQLRAEPGEAMADITSRPDAWTRDYGSEMAVVHELKTWERTATPKFDWDDPHEHLHRMFEAVSEDPAFKAAFIDFCDEPRFEIKATRNTRKGGVYYPARDENGRVAKIVLWRNHEWHKPSASWSARHSYFTAVHELAHHFHKHVAPCKRVRGKTNKFRGSHGVLFRRVLIECWRVLVGPGFAERLEARYEMDGYKVAPGLDWYKTERDAKRESLRQAQKPALNKFERQVIGDLERIKADIVARREMAEATRSEPRQLKRVRAVAVSRSGGDITAAYGSDRADAKAELGWRMSGRPDLKAYWATTRYEETS